MTAASANRAANIDEAGANVLAATRNRLAEKSASPDVGAAAAMSLAAMCPPLFPWITATSRPGKKRSPISICRVAQAEAAVAAQAAADDPEAADDRAADTAEEEVVEAADVAAAEAATTRSHASDVSRSHSKPPDCPGDRVGDIATPAKAFAS
ncbi:hypothetical protein AYO47_02485 [Planctomyces sp. SCGC AG-212-M04]|nr:hypothetical protein AYO47_02485 [Planctomyces sp. SCGC AG-212-M04]